MLWFSLALLTVYAAFLQATLQAELHWHEAAQLRLCLHLAGFHKTWQYHLNRTAQGHQLHRTDRHGTKPVDTTRLHGNRARILMELLRRADKAWRFLLAHLHLDRLDALLLLRTGDAAHSALLSGGLQGLAGCIPASLRKNVHIRVLPDFFRPHSTLNARCIIRFRLGTIILTAGLLIMAYIREQQPTESEAMQYGTSHR